MPGKFVVKKGTTRKFRVNLISTNGQVVATSEAYTGKAAAMGGITVTSMPNAVTEQVRALWSRMDGAWSAYRGRRCGWWATCG